jgi:hypothetical protein
MKVLETAFIADGALRERMTKQELITGIKTNDDSCALIAKQFLKYQYQGDNVPIAIYKCYLVEMTRNTKVQFVLFETILSFEPFMSRWKEYGRSAKSDADVTVQQSERNGSFRYLAQHRFAREQVQFFFTKEKRNSRVPRESIQSDIAGGYSVLQAERLTGCGPNERKVFAFINDPAADLGIYKHLSAEGKLNIYEPYYHDSKYQFILEYFVKSKNAEDLLVQLKKLGTADVAVYRECKIPKNLKASKKERQGYVWPS